jgi:putative membrane protein
MPGGGHGMWSWWMGGWGWFWLALAALVIVLAVCIARRSGSARGGEGGDGALRILEERFARGEIDREEFEARRRTLRGGPE